MEILIAEDDNQIATSLKNNFSEEGHHVQIAKDGIEALYFAESILFDVIILDWRMPKMTGLEVCRKIREDGYKVPIILLTALSQISNKIEALKIGADDYITKPFSFEELSARIEAILRRYTSNLEQLESGDLRLDLIKRKAYWKSDEILLSMREFELLKYFLLHKGMVLSKEELYKEIWGIELLPSTNIIEATIKNLRKKIEDKTDTILIKSIYGEGYLFIS